MSAPFRHLPELGRRDWLHAALATFAVGCSSSDRETFAPAPSQTPTGATKPAPTETSATTPPAPVDEDVKMDVARRIDAFAFDFYGQLRKTGGNLVYSPASIALAFAMVHAGAKGKTAAELAKVFHLDGDLTRLHGGFAEVMKRWQSSVEGLELAIANRLFGERTTPFEKDYLALTDRVFAAPLESVDFKGAHEAARARINGWVEERTRERIRDLIPVGGINGATRLVLANAIYFKGAWQDEFSASATKPGDFFAPKGKVTAKFMHSERTARSGAADGMRWIELPYENGPFAMVIVLPDAKDGLPKLEAGLSEAKVRGWLETGEYPRVELSLPKFKIEPGDPVRLSKMLGALGLSAPFEANADFTGMAPAKEQIQLAEAFHKAFIAVDEKGTEAAAATAVAMRAGAAIPVDKPVPFVVDHPFLFLLRDTQTHAILFMGRVESPKA